MKLYLTLKYLKTAQKWDEARIECLHREIVDESETVGMSSGGLSLESNGSEEEVKNEKKSKPTNKKSKKESIEWILQYIYSTPAKAAHAEKHGPHSNAR